MFLVELGNIELHWVGQGGARKQASVQARQTNEHAWKASRGGRVGKSKGRGGGPKR